MGKRSANFVTRICAKATVIYGETSSVCDDVWLLVTRKVQMRSVKEVFRWFNS